MTAFAVPAVSTSPAASVNGVPVAGFLTSTRSNHPDHPAPATAATITVSVPMGRDELVAALFYWDYVDAEDLADADHVRLLVTESAVNVGMGRIAELVGEIATGDLGEDGRAWLADCRATIDTHFGPAAPVGAIPVQRPALRLVATDTPAVTLGPLAGRELREVTAGLYFSDYQPGDLNRFGLEAVETHALIGMDGLTPAHVDWVHNTAPDRARMTDCRATARTLLDAQ
ncbi:hypothetical protein IOD16_37730 [Saccharothrix sp. 6-C]|uniref:hypothetical protein n=1 Tax=Saccharothrix sp. 6-C TaxID=2781735 RepID=UPI0019172747|nr:hypothetical protein [Saccharothrix sp. 6-C]QQQ76654.1 hypothetical protein IOD16_37730 [Saccharothrix sp. 6-C]